MAYKAHAYNYRPVWKMANKMCGGQLVKILKFERARGESYDAISRFLSNKYGVDVTRATVMNWCHEIVEAEKRGEL